MNDAQRWAEAMRALGIEWRVGMVDVDGAVCVPWGDTLGFVDCVNGDTPINHIGGTEDVAVGSGGTEYSLPDPHHPSNLGHLLEMVCEVYGCAELWVSRDCEPFAGSDPGDGEYIPTERVRWTAELCYDWDFVCPIGFGKSAPLALLDTLDRKAREAAQ